MGYQVADIVIVHAEALAVRERLLRQRAELTITKLQLEERKHQLALALEVGYWLSCSI